MGGGTAVVRHLSLRTRQPDHVPQLGGILEYVTSVKCLLIYIQVSISAHKSLAHPQDTGLYYFRAKLEPGWSEHNDGGTVFEPTELLPALHRHRAGNLVGPGPSRMKQDTQTMQTDRRDKDRSHCNQCNRLTCLEPEMDDGPFVPTKQLPDPPHGNWIHVPSVATDIGHMLDAGVVGRMKPVVHRRCETQCDVNAVTIGSGRFRTPQKIHQRVGKPFGLDQPRSLNPAACTNDAVARTQHRLWVQIQGPCPGLQLPREALLETVESLMPGLVQIQIREGSPYPDRKARQQGALHPAEPPHPSAHPDAGYAIRQQKIQILLKQQPVADPPKAAIPPTGDTTLDQF